MAEGLGELSENKETSKGEVSEYQRIRPESEVSVEAARDYWDNVYENINSDEVEISNPRQEVIDGKINYFDDNGALYRVENELVPNNEYEMKGYKYSTDECGRIKSAEGLLHMKAPDYERNMEAVRHYEGQDYREGDDRGHLIGHQFGGSDRLENLVPQDARINQNDFRIFECELAERVKAKDSVIVLIEPIYDGDTNRPSDIVVTYSINGVEDIRIFPNEKEK